MPLVSRPWLPTSLRKHVEYPTYFKGSCFSSNQESLCMAHSGCSAVAIRYLSSPSPALAVPNVRRRNQEKNSLICLVPQEFLFTDRLQILTALLHFCSCFPLANQPKC